MAPGVEPPRYGDLAPGVEPPRYGDLSPGVEPPRYGDLAPGVELPRSVVRFRFPDQVPLKFWSKEISAFCSQLYSSPGTKGCSFAKANTHLDMSRRLNNPS